MSTVQSCIRLENFRSFVGNLIGMRMFYAIIAVMLVLIWDFELNHGRLNAWLETCAADTLRVFGLA